MVKTKLLLLFSFIFFMASSSHTFAHVLEHPPVPIKPEFYEPHHVIELFYQAVSKGELTVFSRVINRSMLKPVRVEYVYELDNSVPIVKVYSELKPTIPVPDQEGYEVRGVSTVIDSSGSIIETTSHVWGK